MNRKINPSKISTGMKPQYERESLEVYPLILFFYLLIVFAKQPFEMLALMKHLSVELLTLSKAVCICFLAFLVVWEPMSFLFFILP